MRWLSGQSGTFITQGQLNSEVKRRNFVVPLRSPTAGSRLTERETLIASQIF